MPPTDSASDEPVLMLKDKEVVADPARQYEIARSVHLHHQHGGINKTTASIAERYHWVRIKETVSAVIRNCPECKDASSGRVPVGTMTTGASAGVISGISTSASVGPADVRRSSAAGQGSGHTEAVYGAHGSPESASNRPRRPSANAQAVAERGERDARFDIGTISPHKLHDSFAVDPQLMTFAEPNALARQANRQEGQNYDDFGTFPDTDTLMQFDGTIAYAGAVEEAGGGRTEGS